MKSFLTLALAASICVPAFAQVSGRANQNPPMVNQTVEFAGAKISLNYTSLDWVRGSFWDAAMRKDDKGAQFRQQLATLAKSKPIGTLTTNVDLTCGSLNLTAGEYKVSFTCSEELAWEINFTKGDEVQKMKLDLMDSTGHESKRLLMCLYAGDKAGAGVYVAFGSKSTMLTLTPGKAADKTEKNG